jgi:outer membrane lipoprotein-sorting protein
MAITDLERRQRAAASYAKRRAAKPHETLISDGGFVVTYNPNSSEVTIVNGVEGIKLTESKALALRDALLERLA